MTVLATGAGSGAAAATSHSAQVSPARRGGQAAASRATLPAGHAWKVTLVTGDVVAVRTARGRPPLVTVTPGPGRRHVIFSRFEDSRGQVVVIPQDVVPLLGRVLDPALFDVTALIRAGDDDAHRAALPLIVAARPGTSAQAAAAAVPGLRTGRALPGRDAIAATEPRPVAARLGAWLARKAAAAGTAGLTPRAIGNIGHIWLGGQAPAAQAARPGARAAQRTTYPITVHATPLPGTAHGQMNGFVVAVNLNDLVLNEGVPLSAAGTATVRVPAGRYWILGGVNDSTNPAAERSALMGVPEVKVHGPVSVQFNGAKAAPVTASVTGHPTRMAEEGIWVERAVAGQVAGYGDFNLTPGSRPLLFAGPTGTARTGTFRAYTSFNLTGLHAGRHPYSYNLWHPVGNRVPASLAYRVTPAEQASLARVNSRFYALNGNHAQVWDTRYGLDAAGFLAAEADGKEPGGSTRTDYISTGGGIRWDQEAIPPFEVGGHNQQGLWVIEVPLFAHLVTGSVQTASWIRQPFAPGPYSATVPTTSECAPHATTRAGNYIHVELTQFQDLPDGFDCLGFGGINGVTSVMRLYTGGRLLGTKPSQFADFTVPAKAVRFRLTYTDNTSRVLPVSTRTATTWTFRSPSAGGRIPLLLVRYNLPLNLDNRQDGRAGTLTVTPIAGTPAARVTSLRMWTSTDAGKTWQAVKVRARPGGRYAVTLRRAAPGQAVSLRVMATDSRGSGVEQTIITAYRG